MYVQLESLTKSQVHSWLVQLIVPRPVAWVLSDNGNGSHNLAPFSYFTGIASDPPLLLVSVGRKPDGTRKDTWVNVVERSDFVVHIASRELLEEVSRSSATLPHGESELDLIGLETALMEGSRLPRVVGPKIAMACSCHRVIEVGNAPQGLLLGEIGSVYIDDTLVSREGRDAITVDPLRVDPISRLGGDDYGLLGETRTVRRPR